MTRAEFVAAVAEEIEEAVMRAQGIGDGLGEPAPEVRAASIAGLLPSYAFSEDDDWEAA